MRKKTSLPSFYKIFSVFLFASLLLSGFGQSKEAIVHAQAPIDENEVRQAVLAASVSLTAGGKYSLNIDELKLDTNWALAVVGLRVTKTGEIVSTESAFVLAHLENNTWAAALMGTPNFKNWLTLAPVTVLNQSLREFLLDQKSISFK